MLHTLHGPQRVRIELRVRGGVSWLFAHNQDGGSGMVVLRGMQEGG